ncbi:MAG: hypothetical protein ACQERS_11280 [Bacteroidota bacterium]
MKSLKEAKEICARGNFNNYYFGKKLPLQTKGLLKIPDISKRLAALKRLGKESEWILNTFYIEVDYKFQNTDER